MGLQVWWCFRLSDSVALGPNDHPTTRVVIAAKTTTTTTTTPTTAAATTDTNYRYQDRYRSTLLAAAAVASIITEPLLAGKKTAGYRRHRDRSTKKLGSETCTPPLPKHGRC